MPAELVIESTGRASLPAALRELWSFRSVILTFAERDVRVKYKQAVLGAAWAVLQPLAFMAVFTFIFGRLLAPKVVTDVPYRVLALSGLIGWNFLQTGVSFGANALLADAALIRKVYFPREVPILGSVVGAGVDLGIGLVLFMAVGPLLGADLSITMLYAVPVALGLALLAAGVSLTLGALNVYYRDFRYVLPVAMQLWFFASPAAYPIEAVPEKWRDLYVWVNPAAGLLDSFRRAIAMGQAPDPRRLGQSVVVCVLIFILGYWFFKGLERNFADVV